jgi:hypothetical protein
VGSTVPLWVALVGALLPSVVAISALISAEARDKRRIEHERESRLREERIGAYRKLLAATSSAHVDRDGVRALGEAYEEISLLAGSDELDRAAARVWVEYGKTEKVSRRKPEDWGPGEDHAANFAQALDKARIARERFVRLAREELGVKGRYAGFRDLEGSTPGEALPGPETKP